MKTLKLAGLLLALVASDAALADRWDTLGSKHSRDVVRYGHVDQHPGRGHARGHDRQRGQVNIIVAPRAPVSNWAPDWNQRWYERDYVRNDYRYNYQAPITLYRHEGSGLSISLFGDERSGSACYEYEEDRRGRVTRRRVADRYCGF